MNPQAVTGAVALVILDLESYNKGSLPGLALQDTHKNTWTRGRREEEEGKNL